MPSGSCRRWSTPSRLWRREQFALDEHWRADQLAESGRDMYRVHVDRTAAGVVVEAGGELDAFAAPELAAAFAGVVRESRVVANLDSVSFLDSAALGVVVRALREINGHGGNVRVVLPRGSARRIFEITTLDRVLPVAVSRTEALEELRS